MVDKQKNITLSELLIFSLTVGFTSFGGGANTIPLIRKIAVEEKRYVDNETFDTMATMATVFPGPIITQLLALIAYKNRRVLGVITVLSPIIFLLPLLFYIFISVFESYFDKKILQTLTYACVPTILFLMYTYIRSLCVSLYSTIHTKRTIGILSIYSLCALMLLYYFSASFAVLGYVTILFLGASIQSYVQKKKRVLPIRRKND